jgi:hypothetical protein
MKVFHPVSNRENAPPKQSDRAGDQFPTRHRNIQRRLGMGVRVNNGPFNLPAVKGQVDRHPFGFPLEEPQVLFKQLSTFEHASRVEGIVLFAPLHR